jgi:acyl-CoA thioester hydrolase
VSKVFDVGDNAFCLNFQPSAADIDDNNHVNNVVYLGWAQVLAIAHWDSLTTAAERAPWTWVARRHEIDYGRELKPQESAKGYTWVGSLKGPLFERLVRIDGPDGAMRAQVRTEWVLVDIERRRPVRSPEWIRTRFSIPDPAR